jgi:hypothetical protein
VVSLSLVIYFSSADNSGKKSGFAVNPQKCRFAHFANLQFGGKGGHNDTVLGPGPAGLGVCLAPVTSVYVSMSGSG